MTYVYQRETNQQAKKNYLTQINVYLLKGHVQDISSYKHVVGVIKMSQRTCPEVEMDE